MTKEIYQVYANNKILGTFSESLTAHVFIDKIMLENKHKSPFMISHTILDPEFIISQEHIEYIKIQENHRASLERWTEEDFQAYYKPFLDKLDEEGKWNV